MSMQTGVTAPGFTAMPTEGELNFYNGIGDDWVVLVSYPEDFPPVCNTGTGKVARLETEFDRRHVKIIGLSVHPLDAYGGWTETVEW